MSNIFQLKSVPQTHLKISNEILLLLCSGTFKNLSILLGNQEIGATGFKDAQGNKHCTNRPPKIRGLLKFLLLI